MSHTLRGMDEMDSGWPERAKLWGQAKAMYELLKELEWEDHGDPHCACCNYYVGTNKEHAPDCRLAAILKAVEET